jgi:hypothetical protein
MRPRSDRGERAGVSTKSKHEDAMRHAPADVPTTGVRAAAFLLAVVGLIPLVWAGISSRQWNVARLAFVDPAIVLVICALLVLWGGPHAKSAAIGAWRRFLGLPPRAFVAISVAVAATLASLAAWYCFRAQPALTDEMAHAFQGRVLLSGRLAAVGESFPEFFETAQTVRADGRWFSEFPIGSGALAALGAMTGLPWLINPVLAGVAVWATFAFVRRVADEPSARIASLLLAISPFAAFMAGSRMNHVPVLALTALALLAVSHWSSADSAKRAAGPAIALGICVGAMTLFRPYDAVLVAIPVGAFQLWQVSRNRALLPSLAGQVVAGVAVVGVQLWVNAQTTGAPMLFGYDALNGASHRPGFHVNPLGDPFTPAQGFYWQVLYLSRLNTALLESAVPSIAFIVAGMWLAKPATGWDVLMAALIGSVLAGYSAYWFDGNFVGPRFLFIALPAFVWFIARFMTAAARDATHGTWGAVRSLILPVCLVVALLPPRAGGFQTGVSLRLAAMQRDPSAKSPDPEADARRAGLSNALVFVREPLHARMTARLRSLGMPPYAAERAAADLDACALVAALDESDAMSTSRSDRLRVVLDRARAAGVAQPVRGLYGSASLALVGGSPSTPACYGEILGDRAGTETYDRFLAANRVDSAARLGGDVVFVRTLGARDSLLRARFGTRDWYLYRREAGSRAGRFERLTR